MQLYVSALLLALAGQINAQASINYDILNCTSYSEYRKDGNGVYNVPDGQSCTRFYKCDNRNGGKIQDCPDGTVFNKMSGSCDTSDCSLWFNSACRNNFNSFQANAVKNFPARCCRQYFAYQCPESPDKEGTWKFKYCLGQEMFNPATGQCSLNVNGLDCSSCSGPPENPIDPCVAGHLEIVDECHYRSTSAIKTIMSCPPGTYMQRDLEKNFCGCAMHVDSTKCAEPLSQCTNQQRYALDLSTGAPTFLYPSGYRSFVQMIGGVSINGNSVLMGRTGFMKFWFFGGNDIWHTGMTVFRLSFSLNVNSLQNSDVDIFTTGKCNTKDGSSVALMVRRNGGNSLTLTYRVDALSASTQVSAQLNNVGSNPMITVFLSAERTNVGVVLAGRASVNGRTAQLTSPAGNTLTDSLKALKCSLDLGGFPGQITEFAFWKCSGSTNQINNI